MKNEFEYIMPAEIADQLWKGQKGDKQKFLCDYVNTELGLMGTCIGVKISG